MYTPVSVRSPAPDHKAATRSSRSWTPNLNFQRLSLLDHQRPSEAKMLPTIPENKSSTTTKFTQSSAPLYIQPGAENSQPTTPVTLPDGVILIVLDGSSMMHHDPEEVDLVVAHNNKNVFGNSQDIHKPSPYCGWSMSEEEEAEGIRDFNSWLEWRNWLEMKNKVNGGKKAN